MIKRLAKMPYAQAHVEIDDEGNATLISYTTPVCSLTRDGWLTVYGLYSMTTRKHIGAFMQEYAHQSYQTAKECYFGNHDINLFTGEVLVHE